MSASGVARGHECRQLEMCEKHGSLVKAGVLRLRLSVRERSDKLRSG